MKFLMMWRTPWAVSHSEELAEYFAMVKKVIAGFLASLEINIFNYSLSADGRGDIKYFTD